MHESCVSFCGVPELWCHPRFLECVGRLLRGRIRGTGHELCRIHIKRVPVANRICCILVPKKTFRWVPLCRRRLCPSLVKSCVPFCYSGGMAPTKVRKPRKSAKNYRSNAASRAKKAAYDTKFNRRPGQAKKRAELSKARRARGIMGKGGKDLSHTKTGKLVRENPSTNRARNRGRK